MIIIIIIINYDYFNCLLGEDVRHHSGVCLVHHHVQRPGQQEYYHHTDNRWDGAS